MNSVQNGKYILVVEDDKELLTSIETALKTAGYNAIAVANARDAMFRLRNQKFSCIVLDLKLGDKSGVDLVEFLRESKELPNFRTPVLIASANFTEEVAKRLVGKFQGALIKPFDTKTLVERVSKLAV